jgi:trehalose 6-phosphate synthase
MRVGRSGPGNEVEVANAQIIIASNRGPVTFATNENGRVMPKRGTGGLVTALTGALQHSGGLWIASAMTDEDRTQAAAGRIDVSMPEGSFSVRYLAFEPEVYERFYNRISNSVLWFLHHYLWDIPRKPRFDAEASLDWAAYRAVNESFAHALDEEGAGLRDAPAYLIQDYHLALAPELLRQRRPEARIAHFSHIPFAGPSYFRILPASIRRELLTGLLGADVLGFQAGAWADNFLLCCRALPEARVDLKRRLVRWQDRKIKVRLYPISIDIEALKARAGTAAVARARRRIRRLVGNAKLLLRVDRAELSKNILRGFQAYGAFLVEHPEWRRRVRFLALLNPSRTELPEYTEYIRECLDEAERINRELGDENWQPVEVLLRDDHDLSVAAFGMYDVLLVNPVYDGMNLVAKEGPSLNRRRGVLILSENSGAHEELGRHAIGINPFDVGATAGAIATALDMGPAERTRRALGLRRAVRRGSVDRWVGAQLEDLHAGPSA